MNEKQTMPESGKKNVIRNLVVFLIVFIVLAALLAMSIPAFFRNRNTAAQEACIRNMRMIDAGRGQWAIDTNNIPATEPQSTADSERDAPVDLCVKRTPKASRSENRHIAAFIVKEYPLVYPVWEDDREKVGCLYRFSGVKSIIKNDKFIYIVSETDSLPNVGNTIMIEIPSLSAARLGSLDEISVYDISKLKYQMDNHREKHEARQMN